MKGFSSTAYSVQPAKSRRWWRGLAIAVLGLVLLSMLVPLVLLLNNFHSSLPGYGGEQHNSESNHLRMYEKKGAADYTDQSKEQQSRHVDKLIRRLGPTFPKDVGVNSVKKEGNETHGSAVQVDLPKPHKTTNNARPIPKNDNGEDMKDANESQKLCELKFGSYCLWRREHRSKVEDSVVKKMKDLLYVARAYFPSIAKLPAYDKLSHQMRQNIQDFERIFSEATTDKDLPPGIMKKLSIMETTIEKAKACPVDCNNVDKKFRQLVDLTEDEANFHMKQSAFLYQLAVQTMPKSLHCLSMRLTVEFFKDPFEMDQSLTEKILDPGLHHYIIFSRNVLAASVVINSTATHAKESKKQVFHVVTDQENYFAMKLWFSRNTYREAIVEVLNIEEVNNNNHLMSMPEEFRVSFRTVDKLSTMQIRTEYLSVFSHTHYLLPEVFKTLEKVVVLDDDVLVQRDLSDLWSLDMKGKVNGAGQFCAVKLVQLKDYLSGNSYNEHSCAWMSGLNILDLSRWKEYKLTEKFQRLVLEMGAEEESSETATLGASLLTFQDLVYPLDDRWIISGLGHDYSLDSTALQESAVLHFNGKMKPWLELGIPKYKNFWKKFLTQDQFLSDCNVNL